MRRPMKNLLAAFLILFTAFAGRAQEKNFIDQPYVEVAGSSDTAVTPDEIYLRIVISEADSRNRTSVESQEAQMVAALKSMGINTEKDLTVGDAGSDFGTCFLRGKQVLKTKTYILKVGDARAGTVAISKLEALDISNISLDRVVHSDIENIRNRVRTKAVADAQKRAAALVKGVGQILGAALFIAEVPYAVPVPRNGYIIDGMNQSSVKREELAVIEFQKIRVAIGVNVKFLMRYNTY